MFEEIIFSDPIVTYIFFVLSYAILGGGIKYIDDAFDEKTFSVNKALLLAPILGVFWAYLMSLHAASATILLAIVLAVLLKGKIDNIAHQAGLVGIIGVVLVSGYFEFIWLGLIVITIAGILDEVGNDYVDRKDLYGKGDIISKIIHYFFEYRFTMKLAVFAFAFAGFYDWVYFLAFIGFDIAYVALTWYSLYLKNLSNFTYRQRNGNHLERIVNGRNGTNKDSGRLTEA